MKQALDRVQQTTELRAQQLPGRRDGSGAGARHGSGRA